MDMFGLLFSFLPLLAAGVCKIAGPAVFCEVNNQPLGTGSAKRRPQQLVHRLRTFAVEKPVFCDSSLWPLSGASQAPNSSLDG